jgi:RNA polymerase primary sigma factor
MKAMELGNFVRDERTCNAFDATSSETEITQLKEAIKRLPERARYVLVRRYGLDDTKPATLAKLRAELRISRERI